MPAWMDQSPLVPLLMLACWSQVVFWFIAWQGGWRLLARRFRTQRSFPTQKWRMQSAEMRFLANYNNCLTIGANAAGLYLAPMFLFRLWHPPLFIPWSEITFERKQFLFFRSVEFRLGMAEKIRFKVSGRLGAKLEAAAGPNWPTPYYQAPAAMPPPIG
ncbi:MAG TPA: hypothetical protein VFK06_06295 [Candidatus Angelobacter sp.]|nr:hypothetical protein [Candidatus Angelobacter sp.]